MNNAVFVNRKHVEADFFDKQTIFIQFQNFIGVSTPCFYDTALAYYLKTYILF